MEASQAKLYYAFTRAVCSYAITVWAIQICKNKNHEEMLNALLSGKKSSGGFMQP